MKFTTFTTNCCLVRVYNVPFRVWYRSSDTGSIAWCDALANYAARGGDDVIANVCEALELVLEKVDDVTINIEAQYGCSPLTHFPRGFDRHHEYTGHGEGLGRGLRHQCLLEANERITTQVPCGSAV